MDITGLSASSYQSYSDCEWLFYLTQILKFPSESGPAALLGTISHKVLEILSIASIIKHRKDSKIWDPNYLWELSFNHYYNELPHIAQQITDDKIKKVCKGIHNLLNSEHTPIRENTISAEAAFNIPLQTPEFKLPDGQYFTTRGRIDRVDKINNDTVEVVDYKSGTRVSYSTESRHKKEPSDLHQEIQPRLYHLAAKHLYPWAKNFLVTFIYFTDGGAITVPFCDADIEGTKDLILRRYRTIKNNDDPQRNRTWKCNKFCSFGPYDGGLCNDIWNESKEVGFNFLKEKYTILNIKPKIK